MNTAATETTDSIARENRLALRGYYRFTPQHRRPEDQALAATAAHFAEQGRYVDDVPMEELAAEMRRNA